MNDQEIIQYLMRQNDILLSIISGTYVQASPSPGGIVPDNHRQSEELAKLFDPRDSSLSGGDLS